MTPTELEQLNFILKRAYKDTCDDLCRANEIIEDLQFCLHWADKTIEMEQRALRAMNEELKIWQGIAGN